MAVSGVRTRLHRLHGTTPLLAHGRSVATLGVIGTGAIETINQKDPDVNGKMSILANVRVTPDNNLTLISAFPTSGSIAFVVRNNGAGNSTAGAIHISYIGA